MWTAATVAVAVDAVLRACGARNQNPVPVQPLIIKINSPDRTTLMMMDPRQPL